MAKSWKDKEAEVLEKLKSEDSETYQWVKNSVNLDPNNDIRRKTRDELLKMFPGVVEVDHQQHESLNDIACLRTLIWQSWLMIQTGNLNPVHGNIRSFWYRELEPFLIDHQLMESDTGGPVLYSPSPAQYDEYDTEYDRKYEWPQTSMIDVHRRIDAECADRESQPVLRAHRDVYLQNSISKCFGEMVLRGIFTFKDGFGFADPREDFRIIGRKRPHLVLVTEKEGLFWLCQYANKKHGISAIASKGETGLLAWEYTVGALKRARREAPDERVASLVGASLTDYDAWGHEIADNILEKLAAPIFFGRKVTLEKLNAKRSDLSKFFTEDALRRYRRDLLKDYNQHSKGTQIDAWGRLTGGVSLPGDEPGRYYGIHIDVADEDRLKKAVDDWVKSHHHG